jgi:uncharacterized protein YciI
LYIYVRDKESHLKAVVIYEPGTASMDTIMATFPRHKVIVDEFAARGEIIGIGAFAGGREGSMGIFKDRAAAEAFIAKDPFVLEGLVSKYKILDWSDTMLPG